MYKKTPIHSERGGRDEIDFSLPIEDTGSVSRRGRAKTAGYTRQEPQEVYGSANQAGHCRAGIDSAF